MRRIFPTRQELAVLAALAVFCAVLMICLAGFDLAVAIAAFPVVLAAMLMGARRGGQLSAQRPSRGSDQVKEPM
ncbi:MAG TPA: hypothetical protein VHP11_16960 [Tepidisphaeraceae bacterium]|nr:hypothetical protein [Tepidisphaeraceae bacterium]